MQEISEISFSLGGAWEGERKAACFYENHNGFTGAVTIGTCAPFYSKV